MTNSRVRPVFHSLRIKERVDETRDAISIALDVPQELKNTFAFSAGQYLTLQSTVAGAAVRRSYSICSAPVDFENHGELRIAIKRVDGGVYSTFAHEQFRSGDTLLVMPPDGRFLIDTPLKETPSLHYVAFAAGSGITPILSMMRTALATQANSLFTLVYGNRTADSILFLEALAGLKNKYMGRVRLINILSRQPQETSLLNGRIDAEKVQQLLASLIPIQSIDRAFICGPNSMIDAVEAALIFAGLDKKQILSERFGTPITSTQKQIKTTAPLSSTDKHATLHIVLDGSTRTMPFAFNGPKLLDVALAAGLDLPYACKGGVCCTCRARVMSGTVSMEKNYTLEKWEIDKGYVLTCQCLPTTDTVVVSFDER